jgi:hypothetical protein
MNLPGIGQFKPADKPQGGGFARPRRPEERKKLPLGDFKVNPPEYRGPTAIGFGQPMQAYGRGGGKVGHGAALSPI